jgi:hypothetical protein
MQGHATRGPDLQQPAPDAEADLRLAVGAIFKNEGPYILEWVAFHRVVGVDRFFIADNASDDGSTELLAALDRAGIVTHIPFPGVPGRPPQLPAYAEILRRHGREADWISFIDADEFLLPVAPELSLRPTLAALHRRPEVGAVVANWAAYGSSGEATAREGLVIERFTARARHDALLNHHYKTILRPRAFAGVHETPHLFRLGDGYFAVHADGSPVVPYDGRHHGLSRAVAWAPIRLNHYVVKSREEFFERKRRRGRATQNAQRDAGFFATHDRNEERDPMPNRLIEATKAEKRRLIERLRAAGWEGAEPALRRAGRSLAAVGRAGAQGRIDRIEAVGQVVRVRGWALTAAKTPMAHFIVRVGGQAVELLDVVRLARPDVVRVHPGADPRAGFALTVVREGVEAPDDAPVSLLAIGPDGASTRIDPPKPFPWGRARAAAQAAYAEVPEAPIMPAAGTAALTEALGATRCYLEYGSGGSTLLAVRSGVPDLVTIESDRPWLDAVRAGLGDRLRPDRHHLRHADIGPTAQFGTPASERAWRRFPGYALDAWSFCRERDLEPDLVLIDGRFRAACLLATLIHARPGTRVLFDDYAERSAYHVASDFAAPPRMIDRLAAFTVPEQRAAGLWEAFLAAVGDPL